MRSRNNRWAFLLLSLSLIGCTPTDDGEPSPREVRKHLAEALTSPGVASEDRLTVTDFQPDGEHRYQTTAKDSTGATYHVTVTTKGRSLTYQAERDHPGGPSTKILRGIGASWPEPPFDERHPDLMQWLRGSLCGLHIVGVLWPIMGRFGWRRRYSPGVERFLRVFAMVNVGFALLWGYLLVTNMGNA